MNTKTKRILTLSAIIIASVILGYLQENPIDGGEKVFITSFGTVAFTFPSGWFVSKEDTPYDLQCFSRFERSTTGVFQFERIDLAEEFTAEELLQSQIDDLRSKRNNFNVFEEKEVLSDDEIKQTIIVYSGEKGPSRYYYRFTLIEFLESPDTILVALQVTIPSYWEEHKPILEDITASARKITSKANKANEPTSDNAGDPVETQSEAALF